MHGSMTRNPPVEVLAPEPPLAPVQPTPPPRPVVKLRLKRRIKRYGLWHPMRWYTRLEFPRYGFILDWYGINAQHEWLDAPTLTTRERFTGWTIRLDLSDFFQRLEYFFGATTELALVSLMQRAIGRAEVFFDGGANTGLLSLLGASLVGPRGQVLAFEPNPGVYRHLRWHVDQNRISQITCFQAGLSDTTETLPVLMPGTGNFAAGTLGGIPARYGADVTRIGECRTVRADDMLDPADTRPLFVKLDVEGFEVRTLKGMLNTIRRRLPAVVAEVNDEMLQVNGSSSLEMHSLLADLGYSAFALDRGGFITRHRLWLHPLQPHEIAWEKDVVWLHPKGPHWERLARCMQPRGRYWRHIRIARGERADAF
jgi:FkbM family methyltransferase